MRAYLAILRVFIRMSLQNDMAYRFNLLINVGLALVGMANAIVGVAVIFSHTSTLGGWTLRETLVLVGVYTLVNGVLNMFVAPNLDSLSESIRQGTLDFTLLKPASSQFLVSFQRCVIWGVTDIVLGIGIVLYSVRALSGPAISWGPLAVFALTLAAGVVVLYSLWIMLATFAFWFVRIDNMTTLLHSLFGMGRFPIDAYPIWMRRVLTFVVPIAMITTVPAEALGGRVATIVPAVSVLVAGLAFWLSTRLWRKGLGRYTSASS